MLASISLSGQVTIQPLSGYENLQRLAAQGKGSTASEKVDCDAVDLSGFTVVRPGQTVRRLIRPDTSGLIGGVTYSCTDCAATGGNVVLRRDTLIYTANADEEEVLDNLVFRACTSNGTDCGTPLTVRVLVQREGRTVNLPGQTGEVGERLTLATPDNSLTRKATCRSVEACAPDYRGRDRDFAFDSSPTAGNDVTYDVSAYAGVDAICVTVCSEFGLCDTYRTEVTIARNATALPFFDDFSGGGFRPAVARWQDRDVLVNRTFAQLPPSIGVATFDAVDADGFSYPATGGGRRTFPRDYLTSTPLNMVGQEGSTLSFYLQPRGLGNRPERQDSFVVQFLRPNGNFQTVFAVEGLRNNVPTDSVLAFQRYAIPVAGEFLYGGFVFRFLNKSNQSGAVDNWHLDYVKLDRAAVAAGTRDLALVKEPGSILAPLTSLPLRHYQAAGEDLIREDLRIDVHNAAGQQLSLGSVKSSDILISDRAAGTIVAADAAPPEVFGLPVTVAPMSYVSADLAPGWAGLSTVATYLNGLAQDSQRVEISTQYRLEPNGENGELSVSVRVNNTASTTTVLDNYMAYDDGSAEATIFSRVQTRTVVRFPSYVEDELRGIQVRIPRDLGGFGDQKLRLVVYAAGDSLPTDRLYEQDFDIVVPEDIIQDSLEGFTTYLFDEPLQLPTGNFFVGWEQLPAAREITIGYDRNTNSQEFQFADYGSGWRALLGTTKGSLMLRPLLGGFEGFQTSTEGVATVSALVDVFPNPTSGTLHLRSNSESRTRSGRPLQLPTATYHVRLFNLAGALQQTQTGLNDLDLSALPAGAYVLEVSDGLRRSFHKVIRN